MAKKKKSTLNPFMVEKQDGEYCLDLCKDYTPQGYADNVFHLHVRDSGEWDEMIFCEYLKNNPVKAEEYAALKFELKKHFKYDRDAYTEAKGDFSRECVKVAREKRSGNFMMKDNVS